ncbi:hypothetical protein EJ02DRAFT_432053 [Clathrospora elynae]|uniref:LicD/FKTN/FKRP nucleotidyltransferase domain-containing protein n=1 Tax=Clathrospora elynae TaxID=706981 RepID=A0A6A5SYB5_9PLEO|nr:hypothetical protein EJ02DRAFT_432053 [Clathrospora elynae]
MKLPAELHLLLTLALALALTQLTTCSPLRRRDAPFSELQGLTHLTHSFSNPEAISKPTKFFHESTFNAHYDGRFAGTELPFEARTWHLRLMLKAYTETMDRIGIKTWIMHGCLLGWWWNGGLMPWDKDVDVCVEEGGIGELAGWWNMTVHYFHAREFGLVDASTKWSNSGGGGAGGDGRKGGDGRGGRGQEKEKLWERALEEEVRANGKKYLLEVNPNYVNRSTADRWNVIDARWIDTSTGLYIDITTIHTAPTSSTPSEDEDEDEEDSGIKLYTKDQHAYLSSHLFPLRATNFESIPIHIPYAYEALLLEEYGSEALTETWYNGYGFDEQRKEWVKAPKTEWQRAYFRGKESKGGRGTGRISLAGKGGGGRKGNSGKGRKGSV